MMWSLGDAEISYIQVKEHLIDEYGVTTHSTLYTL